MQWSKVGVGSNPICLVCGSQNISLTLYLPGVPVHCNIQWSTYEQAIAAPRGDIRLGLCRDCGHIFNVAFDPALTAYGQEYDNSLHYSPQFNAYAQRLARRLIDKYDVRHSTVLEIGCGKGEFLAMLCRLGSNRGYGFDPSYEPGREETVSEMPDVTFIPDFYTEEYAEYKARLICCRHVLEHLPEPNAFLRGVRNAVADDTGIALYFEVPSTMFILNNNAVWDVIYEHCSYFTVPSLTRLLRQTQFTVTDFYEDFNNQYLCIEAACVPSAELDTASPSELDAIADLLGDLDRNYEATLKTWRGWLQRVTGEGKRIVIWGTGSKGVTFLNLVDPQGVVRYAVDINPHKQGKFVAGTGQKVVAPAFLTKYRPDYVVVMNEIYCSEINETLKSLQVTAEVVSVQTQ